ncbi:MAG: hypothetical protein HQK77_19260, partial [Desulfobacterales bacterium]|nr:hypothetical protein [Desulfobacterales bacterium]
MKIILLLVLCCFFWASIAFVKEIGFIEDFSLSADRNVPLKQLIPGTEEYYYYTCLNHLNNARFKDTDELLKLWLKRYGRTNLVKEIENRKALLEYENHPNDSLKYLKTELGLLFNHQKEIAEKNPDLPSSLDANLIKRETLFKKAIDWHGNTGDGFEEKSFCWLFTQPIHPDLRRHILTRLTQPYYKNLAQHIADDLAYQYSSGFGSLDIHHHLLNEQLDELARLVPDLLNQTAFVNAYLIRLKPSNDVNMEFDQKEKQLYLERLWEFVSTLHPSHNSLKVSVLYHRLVFDQSQGIYDKDRFMAYLALPKHASYINRDYLKKADIKPYVADLNQNFTKSIIFQPIHNDEPLVRDYLMQFMLNESDYKLYLPYISDSYLKECFAETKIVNGIADMEKWYSMLPFDKYQALKERIDIDFAKNNKVLVDVNDKIEFDAYIKNVKKLIVKVYKINTLSFYQTSHQEINTDIDLDGLVPNHEYVLTYDEPNIRRVLRHFEFPELKDKGVYVIELIGSGKSSRALIRKSKLRFIEKTTIAGHEFTMIDEKNNLVQPATIYIGQHAYKTNEKGTILVPYTTSPKKESVILAQGNFASLDFFNHQSEEYSLSAGIYVDREALLKQNKAKVLIRPCVTVSGSMASVKVLQEITLQIDSVDLDGIASSKEINKFTLYDDKESIYEFSIPERLNSLRFELKAKVKNISQNKDQTLSVSQTFTFNEIDKTETIECLHLSRLSAKDECYVLDLLGKNGEPLAQKPVYLSLKHQDFTDLIEITLKTNENGRIFLGKLDGITSIHAKLSEQVVREWNLLSSNDSYYSFLNSHGETTILIPYMGNQATPNYDELGLLERRGGEYCKDWFAAITIKDGFVQLNNLPAGDYEFFFKQLAKKIQIKITGKAEDVKAGYVISSNRFLELKQPKPIQISSIQDEGNQIKLKVENSSAYTRVHVFANRYIPAFSPFECMANIPLVEPASMISLPINNVYLGGRDIGDEYRYVIDRQYVTKYPGNMLKRPGLILNPWAISDTQTQTQTAKPGEQWRQSTPAPSAKISRPEMEITNPILYTDFANLDFLATTAVCLSNLKPDQEGMITLDKSQFKDKPNLNIIAIDIEHTAYQTYVIQEKEFTFPQTKDLKLVLSLNPANHYTEKKNIAVVPTSSEFTLEDILTSEFEAYDSLDKVYRLFTTLSHDANLAEFAFILKWPQLSDAEKIEKYSTYSCHELNFFLFNKDPEFFQKTIAPYLKNKKDKTFLDYVLLFFAGDTKLKAKIGEFSDPWEYLNLNAVEKILLSKICDDSHTQRHIKDVLDLVPVDIEHVNFLFNTALKTSSLDTDKGFGFEDAKKKLEDKMAYDEPRFLRTKSESGERFMREAEEEMDMDEVVRSEEKSRRSLKAQSAPPVAGAMAPPSIAGADYFMEKRKDAQRFYQKLDKTKEYAENNYYHVLIEHQNADRIKPNRFWLDYATAEKNKPFFSPHIAEASTNFSEMMLALAVLDLPFTAKEHQTTFTQNKMVLKSASPLIMYSKEIKETTESKANHQILVSQNFFRLSDRYLYENNESIEKYVTEEFLPEVVYGCHIIITNPSTAKKKLDVLLQIPQGSLPVNQSHYTDSLHIDLGSYQTQTIEYYFYFPQKGKYSHFPVHVSQNENLIAYTEPFTFNVVETLSKIDKTSWDYISQHASDSDVLAYLEKNNIHRVNLERIAFRLKDKGFFTKLIR